jgi:phytoene dehydrogenase-like protein
MRARTAIVIGGGPAGLVAANHLLDAGLSVAVLEARSAMGGRAVSHHVDGFILNEGPHALYLGGPAHRELRRLGIRLSGALPRAFDPRLVDGAGRARRLPPRDLARLGRRLTRAHPEDVAGLTALEWLDDDPVGRAFTHVATFTGPLERLSADAAVVQLRAGARGVRYLHGGWQALVDRLAARAWDRGAELACGAAVRSVESDGGRWAVVTDDEERHADVVVVAAGGPARASRLLGVDIGVPGPPAEASVLDLGLERLPRWSRRFAAGLDAPRYLSVHAPPAKLAEDGVLVSVAAYGRAPRADLEAFTDAVQPGWRERVTMTRHLPAMTVITAIPTPDTGGLAGRPGPEVPGAPGAFVAGDWVGPEGLLLDAAVASAVAAADAAAAYVARPRVAVAA